MQTTQPDAIVAELREVRDEHAARFDYDVEAIIRDIRAMQNSSDREYVRPPLAVSLRESAARRSPDSRADQAGEARHLADTGR